MLFKWPRHRRRNTQFHKLCPFFRTHFSALGVKCATTTDYNDDWKRARCRLWKWSVLPALEENGMKEKSLKFLSDVVCWLDLKMSNKKSSPDSLLPSILRYFSFFRLFCVYLHTSKKPSTATTHPHQLEWVIFHSDDVKFFSSTKFGTQANSREKKGESCRRRRHVVPFQVSVTASTSSSSLAVSMASVNHDDDNRRKFFIRFILLKESKSCVSCDEILCFLT